MKLILKLTLIGLLPLVMACASTADANLEDARFALDAGNYSLAIEKAAIAVANDSTSVEARRILASAYLGRSGIDFLDLAQEIIDLDSATVTSFRQIASSLPATADLDDLRSAITTLQGVTGITGSTLVGDELKDAAFDLGVMQVIEHFAIGIYGSDYFNTLDVSLVDATDKANTQSDLINFDNRLIASGVDASEAYIQDVRHMYCVLEPITSGDGFTLPEYRAYLACQLSEDPTSVNTVALVGDQDGDSTNDIADCSDIDPDSQSSSVQACYTQDTTL